MRIAKSPVKPTTTLLTSMGSSDDRKKSTEDAEVPCIDDARNKPELLRGARPGSPDSTCRPVHREDGCRVGVRHADVSTSSSYTSRIILGVLRIHETQPVGETRVGDLVVPANKDWMNDVCTSTTQFTLRLRKHPVTHPEDYVIWPSSSVGVVIEADGGLRRVLVETGHTGWALSIQLKRYVP